MGVVFLALDLKWLALQANEERGKVHKRFLEEFQQNKEGGLKPLYFIV